MDRMGQPDGRTPARQNVRNPECILQTATAGVILIYERFAYG
jgi:hypothetical protein